MVNDKNAYDQANENYLRAQQAFAGPDAVTLSRAISQATLPLNLITDAAGITHPSYAVTPDLNTWFINALAQIFESKGTPISFEIDLSNAQTSQGQQSSYANSSSSGGGGFWFWGSVVISPPPAARRAARISARWSTI